MSESQLFVIFFILLKGPSLMMRFYAHDGVDLQMDGSLRRKLHRAINVAQSRARKSQQKTQLETPGPYVLDFVRHITKPVLLTFQPKISTHGSAAAIFNLLHTL
jgi:hypothetical protein